MVHHGNGSTPPLSTHRNWQHSASLFVPDSGSTHVMLFHKSAFTKVTSTPTSSVQAWLLEINVTVTRVLSHLHNLQAERHPECCYDQLLWLTMSTTRLKWPSSLCNFLTCHLPSQLWMPPQSVEPVRLHAMPHTASVLHQAGVLKTGTSAVAYSWW